LRKVPVPESGGNRKNKQGGNVEKKNVGNEYVGEIYQQAIHCPKAETLKKITEII